VHLGVRDALPRFALQGGERHGLVDHAGGTEGPVDDCGFIHVAPDSVDAVAEQPGVQIAPPAAHPGAAEIRKKRFARPDVA
jgi:hypothetical protein